MRSFEELHHAAMELRQTLLAEGRDPRESIFTVTQHERCVLMDRPFPSVVVDHANARFCGFKLHVI